MAKKKKKKTGPKPRPDLRKPLSCIYLDTKILNWIGNKALDEGTSKSAMLRTMLDRSDPTLESLYVKSSNAEKVQDKLQISFRNHPDVDETIRVLAKKYFASINEVLVGIITSLYREEQARLTDKRTIFDF